MTLPAATLQDQLDAAYLALDGLARDRDAWRGRANAASAEVRSGEAALAATRAERDAVVARMQDALNRFAGDNDRMRTAYRALAEPFALAVGRLTALRAEQAAALATEKARYDALFDATEQVVAERNRLATALQELRRSTSWRITRPLRGARRTLDWSARAAARPSRWWPGAGRPALVWAARRTARLLAPASRGLGRAAASWRYRFGRPRTLWGVTPILTLPLLAKCDRLLGLKSDSVVFTTYYISSRFDISFKRLFNHVYEKRPHLAPLFHRLVFRWAIGRYDVFHYFLDRGLLAPERRMEVNEREMDAIRARGARLYTYAYGADVRTREATLALGRHNLCVACPHPGRYCQCDDAEGAGNVARVAQRATAMVAMGDMLAYVPGARNMHYWPLDTARIAFEGTRWRPGEPLRVAHAPNHPQFKGTAHLVAAIERLRAEGAAIELVSVSGVPNTEVIALFRTCHVVADQFTAGFHGYTALEALALGKPVLCYLRDPSMVIDPRHCPIINARPETLHATLRDVLEGRHDLEALGRRGRSYVEHHYSLGAVALRLGAMYLDTAAFPPRVERMIARRMEGLRAALPPLVAGPLPVAWEAVADLGTAAHRGAGVAA